MLIFFTLFFILFSFWIVLFIFNGMLNGIFLIIGVVFSTLISAFVIKVRLYTKRSEFFFLQTGFYKLILKKVFLSFGENVYLAFEFLKPNNGLLPVIDYLLVENDNPTQNALLSNILNLNSGVISCIIKNQCLMVHSISYLFFTPNQLYFLNIEVQNINDDNLI